MKRFAIDLTWVRPGIVGGTESYIRNLLDGMAQLGRADVCAVLLLASDNYESFLEYGKYTCFRLLRCRTSAGVRWKRVLWQNFRMKKLLEQLHIHTCLEPVYGKPLVRMKEVSFYTVIHDLQALHFPEYFGTGRILWMKISWWNAVRTSKKIITISNFVKQDILKHYCCLADHIAVVYNAVCVSGQYADQVLQAYGLQKKRYYYTVSSMLPHKNLKTLVLAMARLKERKDTSFCPLVISGVGGNERAVLERQIQRMGLQKDILFTGYISEEARNSLYKNCRAFLFPSIFEGFGMPLVEALACGVLVIASDIASAREVTAGLAVYVKRPFDAAEWANCISRDHPLPQKEDVEKLLANYQPQKAAAQYINILMDGDKSK